jgi:hypothetical protein
MEVTPGGVSHSKGKYIPFGNEEKGKSLLLYIASRIFSLWVMLKNWLFAFKPPFQMVCFFFMS